MVSDINDLKRRIFFDMLELAGRVFVLVGYAPDVVIGHRGFLPEEKEKGLVLVFNNRMNFDWSGEKISAMLVFGSKNEKCLIPARSILSIFSPELSAHFSVAQFAKDAAAPKARRQKKTAQPPPAGAKVVRVDFAKKKSK